MATLAPHQTALRALLILFAAAVFLYGLFESRKLLEGPRLSLTFPQDGRVIAGPLVQIHGEASNIAFLSVDGKRSYADAAGQFTETLSLPPGYAVIAIEATDRFGRRAYIEHAVEVVDFCPLYPNAIS